MLTLNIIFTAAIVVFLPYRVTVSLYGSIVFALFYYAYFVLIVFVTTAKKLHSIQVAYVMGSPLPRDWDIGKSPPVIENFATIEFTVARIEHARL